MDRRTTIHETIETWTAIDGYEGRYEVSDLGRVRSLSRSVKTYQGTRVLQGRILKTAMTNSGYLKVKLSSPSWYPSIHVLVLTAFSGARENGKVARHLNDIKTDNRLSNLAWGTIQENSVDARHNGKLRHGEQHQWAKLTWDKVDSIRLSSLNHTELARQFGVSRRAIGFVKSFRTWASR